MTASPLKLFVGKVRDLYADRLEISHVMSNMWKQFSVEEQEQIYSHGSPTQQSMEFLDLLKEKTDDAVEEFLQYLELNHPDIVTKCFISVISGISNIINITFA